MGLFDKGYENSTENLYKNIEKYLKQKDGKKHIIMLNTMSKSTTNGLECENKYTIQINNIIEKMQSNGYEIIDIKIDNTMFQSMGSAFLIRTLIVYR
jgi:hypothetical protein